MEKHLKKYILKVFMDLESQNSKCRNTFKRFTWIPNLKFKVWKDFLKTHIRDAHNKFLIKHEENFLFSIVTY